MRRFAFLTVLLLACAAFPASAQSNTSPTPSNDSLFRRARRMVGEGNGTAGRAMVDSILKRAEEGSTAYGDALFWRGALAQTAAEAESDYRRVIVEYPLSHYADDALLAIVELEQARGDRAGALAHLQRFVREHPVSSARGIAALAAARLAFDQRDTKIGCAMITEARASASSTDVELRNQIEYFGSKCVPAAAEVAVVPQASTTPARDTTETAKKPAATPTKKTASVPAPKGKYTIQLAAYGTRTDAEQLVKKLEAKGVTARVSGTTKPFRVRLDFYPTRQAAQEEVAALKQRGIVGFVTEERAPAGKSP